MAEKIATRHAYGEALAEIGSDPKIVALDADVSSCTMSCMFAQKYPERTCTTSCTWASPRPI